MGGKPKAPSPPDPQVTARAQGAQNRETAIAQAILNQTNQQTPFGSLTFNQIGEIDKVPRFEAIQELNPETQAIFDRLQGSALQRLGEEQGGLTTSVNFDDPALGGAVTDRLLPRFERDLARRRESLESQLVNQGFKRGSAGFNEAIRDFGQTETDARNQLNLTGRNQVLQEQLASRNQNLNELGFLLQGGQTQQPQFVGTPQTGVAGVDVAGIINQNFAQRQANFQQANAASNARIGALAGLGGQIAGFALSDRRAKQDIKRVGEMDDGTNIYAYKYKDGRGGGLTQLGVMAQEIEKKNPDAVAEFDGFKHVDYDQVVDHALTA